MKAFLPDEENAPDPEKFKELREECLALLKENFEQLFSGNVDALPIKYNEKTIQIDGSVKKSSEKMHCNYCRFSLICGNNGDKIIDITKD